MIEVKLEENMISYKLIIKLLKMRRLL
jgi:hypothetical protein